MQPGADLAGFFVYFAEVLVPGVGFAELFQIWGEEGLAARVGIALGTGLAVDTVVLMTRTSGVVVGGARAAGLDLPTIYLTVALGVGALAVSLARTRRFSFPSKPGPTDLYLLVLMLILATMTFLHFQKYPIFPEFQSVDYSVHVQYVQGLISGSQVSIPAGALYYGVEYQLATALLLVGGLPLLTLRWTMALLVILSPLLVFVGSKKLFSSAGAALVVTTIYTLSGTVWFVSVFDGGLYPNFFGVMALLFLLATLVGVFEKPKSTGAWGAYVLALVMVYFSHYSAVTLLPVLLLIPLVRFLRTRTEVKRYLIPVVVALAPAAAGLAFPSLVAQAISLAEQGGGIPSLTTPLATALSPVPVLEYMAAEVYGDVSFVFLVIFAAVFLYRMDRSRMALLLIPPFWLALLIAAAPTNVAAWRFSFEAIVPLVLMAGYGVYSVLPKWRPSRRRGQPTTGQYFKIGLVLVLLLTPVVAFSWGVTSVGDSVTDSTGSANAQRNVYSAMNWLEANTSSTSKYLSVSDWRFAFYTDLFFGRSTNYTFFSQPGPAVQLAKEAGYGYIIVTFAVTAAIPPDPSLFPWNNFKPSSNLTLLYSNPDVEVFRVN